jgi:cytidine deaminase
MPDLDALLAAATAELDRRYVGEGGVAAAVALADGTVLLGVGLDCNNEAGALCAETGPICEAFRRQQPVVATACVARDAGGDAPVVLAPCGICRERLAYWGPEVVAAVPLPGGARGSATLRDLTPHYWAAAFPDSFGDWPAEAAER